MSFLGVPILDWVILGALLLLGIEAWVTCRPAKRQPPAAARQAHGVDPDNPQS